MDTDTATQIARYPIGVDHGVLQLESKVLNALSIVSELERAVIFGDMGKQLLLVSDAAAALIGGQCNSLATESDEALGFLQSAPIKETKPPGHNSARSSSVLWLTVGVLLVAGCFVCLYKTSPNWYFGRRDDLNGIAAINSLAKRIIRIESRGDPNAKNSHSSAEGSGQFLNQTWLDLIRKYRPDLAKGHSASELLDLRRNLKLTHAIMLHSIKANPFLEHFTVSDLKAWANRKMRKAREDESSG